MSHALHQIDIQNFKGFKDFSIDLDGRHLLLYGPNGSGKSSLYWALYTFFQSSRRSTESVEKYFDLNHNENLLHVAEGESQVPGKIALTLMNNETPTTSEISLDNHGTKAVPYIANADQASDFITYRFFFGFSSFKNSENFDIWPLFEKEILPFCQSTSGGLLHVIKQWENIEQGNANPRRLGGTGGRNAIQRFKRNVSLFKDALKEILDRINLETKSLYELNFCADDKETVEFELKLIREPSYDHRYGLSKPEIGLALKVGGKEIYRPQSYLNEAKMTQLALSIRFAASMVNLHESPVKLLVLDDLLVSLDMSNRMKVIKMLKSERFADYQKVILTHEKGFFEEFKRHLHSDTENWQFVTLQSPSKWSHSKSDLDLAKEYLAHGKIAECGNRLRKSAEETLTNFIDSARARGCISNPVDSGDFETLHQKINTAKEALSLDGYNKFSDLLDAQFTEVELSAITSPGEIEVSKFSMLPRKERGELIAKLMGAKSGLQESIIALLGEQTHKRRNAISILGEVNLIKGRILNPASHAGVTPLYSQEAEHAVSVISKLNTALGAALETLGEATAEH